MKNIQILIIFLFSIGISAQNISGINSDLKLSDSLKMESEIRIYAGGGITNYSSLFRMYKDKTNKWTAEFYEHYAKVDGQTELRTERRTVESKNDMEFVWNGMLRTNIESLPNMSEIKYKMRERGKVELVDGEYQLMWKSKQIMDGIGYKVQIKTELTSNEIDYDNPESYLKHYSEVDELVFFNELLSLVKNEFNIWKK
jgi:ABC-type Fe3+/spermidine/putrescine transport system ATPase subunit